MKNLLYLSVFVLIFTAATYAGYSHYAFAAPLTNEIVEPSNNLFSLESHYVVGFTTATSGTISSVTMAFPNGFNIANAKPILSSGIGPGAVSVAGQTLTFTVTTPALVPSGTNIMIDLGKIVNNAAVSNTVSVTTRSSPTVIIDGPTTSTAFTLTSATSAMLGTGSVTNPKIVKNAINGTQIIDGSIANADVSNTAAIALSKIATGALPSAITVNSANIVDGSITGADIAPGAALTGSVSIDSSTFKIDSVNHRLGVGTTTPTTQLDVLGNIKGSNNIEWNGGKSGLYGYSGGVIELGDGLTPGDIPFIDFHYGKGIAQDYNIRLINNGDGLLSLYGGVLGVNDSVYVGKVSNPAPGANSLYLYNNQGDGSDTFRLSGSGNNLYMIAKSDTGAATGAGIVFRTAPAGGGELDRMVIDPVGNLNINPGGNLNLAAGDVLVGVVPHPDNAGSNSLYVTNDNGDSFNSFRLDAVANNLWMVAASDPGAAIGSGIVFATGPAGGGELNRMSIDSAGNVNINAGGKLVCAGCITSADSASGIKVIDCTNLVSGALLLGCNLSGMDLHGKNLSLANLSGADLTNANLTGADLHSANLGRTNLGSANLHNANLQDTYLTGADLSGANLSGADLTNANIIGARLISGANLSGSNLNHANFEGAILLGAINQPTGSVSCYGIPIHASFTCTG